MSTPTVSYPDANLARRFRPEAYAASQGIEEAGDYLAGFKSDAKV